MDSAFARRQMVRQQVRAWEVFDPDTLTLLETLERDDFVPPEFANLAYADTQIPLPRGQVMMTPIVEGRLLQALELGPEDRVLEVGTGSGFLAACLSRLASSVVSIDIFDDLIAMAARNLERAAIDNVVLESMDAMREIPDRSFDAIAVTGSMAEFDPRFAEALKPGGRLFVIVGDPPVMEARLIVRVGHDDWRTDTLFETCMQPLINAGRKTTFSF